MCIRIVMVAICLVVTSQLSAQDKPVKALELEGGTAWLNTAGPLKLADLRGKVVILDFWTFCCINCIHILPDLEKLEKKYPNELVVNGVHSAKFNAEKETKNIREAILRYHIEHPVVNDANHKIWNAYGVRSWPTFWVIDPEGNLVGQTAGEGKLDLLDKVVAKQIEKHRQKKTLNSMPLRMALERDKVRAVASESPLNFPGKILADRQRLFIADSSNHRIVITDLQGKKIDVAGSGVAGNAEGSFEKALFKDPQGMALRGDILYVADRKNHQIKALDLKKRTVSNVAGVGKQGRSNGGPAKVTPLNSPWDLCLVRDQLYIAMAGHHQLWRLDLANDLIGPFAGNGIEDLVDGTHMSCSFAQPSGLATDGNWLFVADSEVSAIRAASLGNSNQVQTLLGKGLFDFGDKDGTGPAVRLQHCLGVSMWNSNIIIADTYNNKLKVLEPISRQVLTLVGDGKPGNSDQPPRFNEPAGIHVVGDTAYVADTNNHQIRIVDLKKRTVQTLKITGLKSPGVEVSQKPSFRNVVNVALESAKLSASGVVNLEFQVTVPAGSKVDPASPLVYLVEAFDGDKKIVHEMFGELFGSIQVSIPVEKISKAKKMKVSLEYYPCTEGKGICQVKSQTWEMPVTFAADGASKVKLETR